MDQYHQYGLDTSWDMVHDPRTKQTSTALDFQKALASNIVYPIEHDKRSPTTPHNANQLRSTGSTSPPFPTGLMIHVDKRSHQYPDGMSNQMALPSNRTWDISPTLKHSLHESAPSRSSSQSVFQDGTQTRATSNGPVTPNVVPQYTLPRKGSDASAMQREQQYVYNNDFEYASDNTSFLQHPHHHDSQPNIWNSNVYYNTNTSFDYYPTTYQVRNFQSAYYPSSHAQSSTNQYVPPPKRSMTLRNEVLGPKSIAKKPARKHFTPEVTNILKTWFKENSHRPYPSEDTKQELLMQTGLSMNQLSNWFINARRRNWRRSRLSSRD